MLQPTRLISTPFAQEGEKTEIQNVTGEFDNSATYRLGFPPLTMQSIRSGGKPPKGTDFNGVLFDITENISFLCKGGRYQYNAGLSTLIGGYPEGSNLLLDDNVTEVVSTVAGNQNNPNTDMTGWVLKPNKTTAVNVADASGETQQQVNYNGGSKWHSRVGGYKENERVVLANGDIVKSTVNGNANDPNVDMTGWELPQARDVFDESGLSQQEINDKRKKNPFDFGAVGDGIANDIEAIRATINARGEITSGIFYCELNSDDDTLVIPDGFVLNCSSDSKFIYDFWGSPLFALIGNNGSGIKGHNIEYRGVYDASIGLTTRTFKSYSRAIVRHRYCADIIVLGGNNNSIIGTHSGTNPQNIGVLFEPNADGSLAKNNTADISANYRCQSIVSSGQIGFDFKVNQGVLATNSQALYGPAHAIYDVQEVISKDGKYTIIDTGEYSDSVNMTETHTLSLKYAESVVAEINSSRSAGPLNFAGCTGCTFNLTSVYDGIVATASVGHIFYTSINGRVEPSDGNTINANILLTGAAHNGRIYDSSFGASVAPITGTVANISFLRTVDGTHGHALKIGDTGGVFNITSTQKGDTNRPIIEFSGGNSNTANINVIEGGSRIVYTSGVGNVVNLKGNIPTVQSNIPTAGNTSNVVMPSYKNRLTTSQVTNPSFSIQLPPKFGVYLVSLKLATADSNHARSGVWLVNHDDSSTFDFASCQLIGVQITKGAGDSIPTSLDLTVNSTGLLSVASASKLNFYILDYGFLAIA